MTNLTVEQSNAVARAEQIQGYREMRDAFVAVFGAPGSPSVHGAYVLDYIDKFCHRDKLNVVSDERGSTDIPKTFLRIGRREVADAIHNAISWKEPTDAHSS